MHGGKTRAHIMIWYVHRSPLLVRNERFVQNLSRWRTQSRDEQIKYKRNITVTKKHFLTSIFYYIVNETKVNNTIFVLLDYAY